MYDKFEKVILYTAVASYGMSSDRSAADTIIELISDDPDNRIDNELVVLDWQVEDMELVAKEKTAIEKLMLMDNVVDIVIDKQGG